MRAKSQNSDQDIDDSLLRESLYLMQQGFDISSGFKPFGAIVARSGIVIAKGVNTCIRDRDPTAHAEINAIRIAAQKIGSHDPCYPGKVRELSFQA